LQRALDFYNADIIITNWHKIIDANTVKKYAGKFINLHYSLLPAFSGFIGDKPVKSAMAKGCRFIGTTVHFVNEAVDDGAIIGQTILDVEDFNKKSDDIMGKIFRDGAINLLNSILEIKTFKSDFSKYVDTEVSISPKLNFDSSFLVNNNFWLSLDEVDK
jgi:phosphoribosylglycinamide formyltransferase-1